MRKKYPVVMPKIQQTRVVLKHAVHYLPAECVVVGGPLVSFYANNRLQLSVPAESFLFAESIER
jgi:hypothetical protein